MSLFNLSIFPPMRSEQEIRQPIENNTIKIPTSGQWDSDRVTKLFEVSTGRMNRIVSNCVFTTDPNVQQARHLIKFGLKKSAEQSESFTAFLLPANKQTLNNHPFDMVVVSDDQKSCGASKKVYPLLEAYRVLKSNENEYSFHPIDKLIKEQAQKQFMFLISSDKKNFPKILERSLNEHKTANLFDSVHHIHSYGILNDSFLCTSLTVHENGGIDLATFLPRVLLSGPQAKEISGQIVCGLSDFLKIGYAFYDCSFKNITVSEGGTVKFIDPDGWFTGNRLNDGFSPPFADIAIIFSQIKQLATGSVSGQFTYQIPTKQIPSENTRQEILKANEWLTEHINFDLLDLESINVWAAGILIIRVMTSSEDLKPLFTDTFLQSLEKNCLMPWSKSIIEVNNKIRSIRGYKVESKDEQFANTSLLEYLKKFMDNFNMPIFKPSKDPLIGCLGRIISVNLAQRPKLEELKKGFKCEVDHNKMIKTIFSASKCMLRNTQTFSKTDKQETTQPKVEDTAIDLGRGETQPKELSIELGEVMLKKQCIEELDNTQEKD